MACGLGQVVLLHVHNFFLLSFFLSVPKQTHVYIYGWALVRSEDKGKKKKRKKLPFAVINSSVFTHIRREENWKW